MSTPRVAAEKLILAVFIAIAAIVGLLPTIFHLGTKSALFGGYRLACLFAALGAFVASIKFFARNSGESLAHGPGNLEFLLRALAAVSFWGFLGVIWLSVYGILYWLARFVNAVVVWLSGPELNAGTVAFYFSLGFALLFAIGIAVAIAQQITNRLYSARVGSRIASYSQVLKGQRKTWIYSGLSVAFLFLMFFLLSRRGESWGYWTHFGLQLIPYVSCGWLLGLGARVRKDSEIVNAIGSLLTAVGYQVVYSPQVADPAFQSLVSGMDIVATKGHEALVVQVKTLSSSVAPVDWAAGSSLRMKAQALEFPTVREMLDMPTLKETDTIRPLLVLAGREQDSSLTAFAEQESLAVVVVEVEGIEKILKTGNPAELRALADQYFPDLHLETRSDESLMKAPDEGSVKEGQWA